MVWMTKWVSVNAKEVFLAPSAGIWYFYEVPNMACVDTDSVDSFISVVSSTTTVSFFSTNI